MDKKNKTLQEDYFNDVYRANEDPWNFETSDYERDKYEVTVDALPRDRYKNAFEIGCSIGVLSRMLSQKCDRLLSVDAVEAPLIKARVALKDYPQVRVQKMAVPDQFPSDNFDLIVMSEVGYYLSMTDLERLKDEIIQHLETNGHLLMVHWTPFVPDYPLTGDEVHDFFMQSVGLGSSFKHLLCKRTESYRLDLFEKQ
ncbi:SAM-dependent methyltransferase [Arcticibacter svalbardensis]|uniref:SAM-dependent methyltransferase n=1 Tax=Arcticibacter svalbardensis TaxID=1288027 RepID=UPI0005903551|nr:SAM-dependent methyltransferase [Arcticibacter svalbardensis]